MAPGHSICHYLYSRFIRESIQLALVAREFAPCLPRDLLDKNVGYLWSYQDLKLNLLNMVECLTWKNIHICTVTKQHNMSCLVGGLEHCNFSIYWEIKHHPTPPHPTPTTGNWSWKSSACACRTARKMMRFLCLCVRRNMNVITPPHPTPPVPKCYPKGMILWCSKWSHGALSDPVL